MLSAYSSAFLGIWVILLTVFVQAAVASIAHRRQRHYVPGVVDAKLSHESFVFRSHRTYINSLENLLLMLGSVIVAIMVGLDSSWVSACIWVYAIARLIHMWLYYTIATPKNPSPRSYFYLLGLLANMVLLVKLGLFLLV
ncbi:MAG: MAPEG family protein [Gammaproteobacteria bacterium]|jgi:uncharacterized MAPEG superfamily protein|nr:MAPEG family protein [Gammaproteobacteria bacterium]MCP4881284.1 MAPEG family protein [Gammaproteobacteria bacterium]MDP6165287.1 MAPEG family protein [Gammaproteobacteria bacterium]